MSIIDAMAPTELLTRPPSEVVDHEDPPSPPAPPDGTDARPSRWRRFHPTTRAGWITLGIAVATAVLYTWSLDKVGYANEYYTAAVKAGSVSWKAWFYGAIDPGSFITVDKPPVALWVMGLSARIFGFSTWSMLLPEVAAGVGSVLILHKLVRSWMGDVAAHIAALAFALTPVAVLMFRFNNPDALLTLLCLGGAWALWSAVKTGRTRDLLVSAALIGLAFDTKMLQAFLVLPAFIAVYLLAGPPKLGKRLLQLVAALVALVVSAGWWVAVVALVPASSRPYIGSTQDNSIISLITGYNGLSRLFGGSGGGPGGGAGGPGGGSNGFGGTSGTWRLFNDAIGGQVSWLLPFAGIALAAGLVATLRRPRTDRERAGWILWGGWALTCAAVFSLSSGVFHPYYTVQLAPAVGALVGGGSVALWRLGRTRSWLQIVLPVAILATAAWSVVLLGRTAGYQTWLTPLIIGGAVLSAIGLWVGGQLHRKAMVTVAAVVAGLTLLAGPAAYSVTTVRSTVGGSLVAAGPSSASTGFPGGMGGGMGGPGGSTSTAGTAELVDYLEANQGDATYLVAAFGSQSSASIIIESGKPVMTIGGFNGGDPAPTLDQFKALVAKGEVKYVLVSGMGGGMGGGPGGGSGSSSISSWVTANGTAVDASAYGGSTNGTLYLVTAGS